MDDNELKRLLDTQAAETRRHFDVVAERQDKRTDAVNEAVSLLAEEMRNGFDSVEETIARVEERIDGVQKSLGGVEERLGGVEVAIARESSETRSMIRLSYTELDRRVRSLEDIVVKLQERVERLEETIH